MAKRCGWGMFHWRSWIQNITSQSTSKSSHSETKVKSHPSVQDRWKASSSLDQTVAYTLPTQLSTYSDWKCGSWHPVWKVTPGRGLKVIEFYYLDRTDLLTRLLWNIFRASLPRSRVAWWASRDLLSYGVLIDSGRRISFSSVDSSPTKTVNNVGISYKDWIRLSSRPRFWSATSARQFTVTIGDTTHRQRISPRPEQVMLIWLQYNDANIMTGAHMNDVGWAVERAAKTSFEGSNWFEKEIKIEYWNADLVLFLSTN